jgi:aminopeptidase
VNYCIGVKPGDRIAIDGNSAGLPLINETLRYVLRAGGLPYLAWQEESFAEIFYKEGNEDQLRYVPEPDAPCIANLMALSAYGAPLIPAF